MSYKKIYMSFNIKRHIHARVIFRCLAGQPRGQQTCPRLCEYVGARAESYFSRLLECTSSAVSIRIACSSPAGLWVC